MFPFGGQGARRPRAEWLLPKRRININEKYTLKKEKKKKDYITKNINEECITVTLTKNNIIKLIKESKTEYNDKNKKTTNCINE